MTWQYTLASTNTQRTPASTPHPVTYTIVFLRKKPVVFISLADNFQVMTCDIHKVRSVITIGGMRQGSFDKGTQTSVLKARKFWRYELYCDTMKAKVTHHCHHIHYTWKDTTLYLVYDLWHGNGCLIVPLLRVVVAIVIGDDSRGGCCWLCCGCCRGRGLRIPPKTEFNLHSFSCVLLGISAHCLFVCFTRG